MKLVGWFVCLFVCLFVSCLFVCLFLSLWCQVNLYFLEALADFTRGKKPVTSKINQCIDALKGCLARDLKVIKGRTIKVLYAGKIKGVYTTPITLTDKDVKGRIFLCTSVSRVLIHTTYL